MSDQIKIGTPAAPATLQQLADLRAGLGFLTAPGNAIVRTDGTLYCLAIAKAAIIMAARVNWRIRVSILKAIYPPVVNPTPGVINTIKFVNPQATFNGNGNGPEDAASGGALGAYNVMPTQVANTSYLFVESSTITGALWGRCSSQ